MSADGARPRARLSLNEALAPHQIRPRRVAALCLVILALAFLSFWLVTPFVLNAALFALWSAALFNIRRVADWLFGGATLSAQERAMLQDLRRAGLLADGREERRQHRLRGITPWPVRAMAVLTWFFVLEFFVTMGGAADWLAQRAVVQELAGLIPAKSFLAGDVRGIARFSASDIVFLKIVKSVYLFSLPFKIWAIALLMTPCLKEHLSVSPLAIQRSRDDQFTRSFFAFLGFWVLLFLAFLFTALLASGDYGAFREKNVAGGVLAYMAATAMIGLFLSAFFRIAVDTVLWLAGLFGWRRDEAR